uniref:Uncharacterized protein n=1 Tax=Zea mays TaxID=4577 RepID=A0A804RH03_MAIZE
MAHRTVNSAYPVAQKTEAPTVGIQRPGGLCDREGAQQQVAVQRTEQNYATTVVSVIERAQNRDGHQRPRPSRLTGAAAQATDLHPSPWGDFFLHHIPCTPSQLLSMKERAKVKEQQVRQIIQETMASSNLLRKLELVDTLQCLGVDYRCNEEIDQLLRSVYDGDKDGGGSDDPVLHAEEAWVINTAKSYHAEVKWRDEHFVPTTVEEHLQISIPSSGRMQMTNLALISSRGNMTTREDAEWVFTFPKIREQASLDHVASTVQTCMKQYEVTEEEANEKLRAINEMAWMDIVQDNLEQERPIALLDTAINVARIADFLYKREDAYTLPFSLKDIIGSMYV